MNPGRFIVERQKELEQLASVVLGGVIAWTLSQVLTAATTWPARPAPQNPCSRNVIPGPRLTHIETYHVEGSPSVGLNSYFYKSMSLVALMKYAQVWFKPPQPEVSPYTKCVRHPRFPIEVGYDRMTKKPTHMYAVITEFDGEIFNMYPGLATSQGG